MYDSHKPKRNILQIFKNQELFGISFFHWLDRIHIINAFFED